MNARYVDFKQQYIPVHGAIISLYGTKMDMVYMDQDAVFAMLWRSRTAQLSIGVQIHAEPVDSLSSDCILP